MKNNIDDLRFELMEAKVKSYEAVSKAQKAVEDFIYSECQRYNIPIDGWKICYDSEYRDEMEEQLRCAYDLERVREQNDARYHEMKEAI